MTFALTLRVLICACAAILCAHQARAEVNLPAICKGTVRDTTCSVPLVYDMPAQTDQVKGNGGYFAQWRLFAGDESTVVVCTANVSRGTSTCPTTATVARSAIAGLPEIRLQWSQDAKNADGTALTDLAGFRIVYGTAANALTQSVEIKDANARAHTLTGLEYSTSYYVALKSYTNKGEESDKSNTVQGTTMAKPSAPLPPTKPVPPVLSVVQTTAYRLDVGSNDQLRAVAVGTVPLSTACIRAQPVLDMFLVPRAAVTLNRGVNSRPRQIAAKCA